jgi:hypothetical protein
MSQARRLPWREVVAIAPSAFFNDSGMVKVFFTRRFWSPAYTTGNAIITRRHLAGREKVFI